MRTRREIAQSILGTEIDADGYTACPGEHLHTTPTAHRCYRIWLNEGSAEMPRDHCFHASCAEIRRAKMAEIWSAIKREERGGGIAPTRDYVPAAPRPAKWPRPVFDPIKSAAIAARCPINPTRDWLREISPVEFSRDARTWPELLIDTLYMPGERILIFSKFESQGQVIRVAGGSNYRLGYRPGQQARRMDPTDTAAFSVGGINRMIGDGLWFLTAPITGEWMPNPNKRTASGEPVLGRRHQACCTRFPFAVIESDTVSEAQWLKILSQVFYPIAAVYTSGSKSIHALIHLGDDCRTKQDFDRKRLQLSLSLVPLGADLAAISAVRLSRLPGGVRNKNGIWREQELLYLNPYPEARPLHTMTPLH